MLLKLNHEPIPVLHVAGVLVKDGLVIHGVPEPLQGGDLVLLPPQAMSHLRPSALSCSWVFWLVAGIHPECFLKSTFLARPARGP